MRDAGQVANMTTVLQGSFLVHTGPAVACVVLAAREGK
jgi:hypothetical protein